MSPGRERPPGDSFRAGRHRDPRSGVVSFVFVVLLLAALVAALFVFDLV